MHTHLPARTHAHITDTPPCKSKFQLFILATTIASNLHCCAPPENSTTTANDLPSPFPHPPPLLAQVTY